ncbi:DUF308 domain-containing protein, partial [Pasteurellaceae bacterium 20609_3]|uniref:DUF308 domain-containing protein n=1 Tax=Spirabiliibacterium mucosae TaxID=28156 RepID=UPI001AADAD63
MKNWHIWLAIGVLSIAFGIIAVINPFAASIAVEQLIAGIFIFIGLIQIYSAWKNPATFRGSMARRRTSACC